MNKLYKLNNINGNKRFIGELFKRYDISYKINGDKIDLYIGDFEYRINVGRTGRIHLGKHIFDNWIMCCEKIVELRYKVNNIGDNQERISEYFEKYDIKKYKFNAYGDNYFITLHNNGRDYKVEVDEDGIIHLYSLNLACNNTKKNHYNEKRTVFKKWAYCCDRISTSHKTYRSGSMFDILNRDNYMKLD